MKHIAFKQWLAEKYSVNRVKVKSFIFLPALIVMLSPANALAYSPQPEYISPELLFEAKQERIELRYEIRVYFEFTELTCGIAPSKKYETAFQEQDRDFENYISSMQNTQLFLDVNIAVQDGQKDAHARQSVVDCSPIALPENASDRSFELSLKMARDQLAKVKNASQIALTRLGEAE